jgi:hypothetical protein
MSNDIKSTSIVQQMIGSIVRQALTIGGAYLVTRGLLTTDQDSQLITVLTPILVGILMTVGATAWSYLNKKQVVATAKAAQAAGVVVPK